MFNASLAVTRNGVIALLTIIGISVEMTMQ
jgi:hypothetical protein